MRNRRSLVLGAVALATAMLAAGGSPARGNGSGSGSGSGTECPQTSSPTSFQDATLDSQTPTKDGVVYDAGGARLQLQGSAGLFKSTALGISDLTVFAAVADFDRDGWDDFVGAGESRAFIRIYRNRTFDNPEPDWNDPNAVRTPEFVGVGDLQADADSFKWRPIGAGDFNGDGWPDVFVAQGNEFTTPSSATVWLNKGVNDGSGNPQFNSGYSAMASGSSTSQLGSQNWGGTNVVVVDYNGDRKLDLLVGSGDSNGTVRVFLNNCTLASPQPTPVPIAPKPLKCSTSPKFAYSSTLITNMGFPSSANLAVFGYTDVDGDGFKDLVAGAPSCCTSATTRLRLWKGVSGGGLSTTAQTITFSGAATTVLLADFSLDGKPDLVVGTDNWNYNAGNGGNSFYWKNNGTGTPFSSASQQLTSTNNPTFDFDVGFVFNYDHDPSNTPDVMIADGNHTSSFYVLANRNVSQYVACGDVASGVLDLGGLAGTEMVVTAARLKPTYSLNGGSIKFYLSNEEPPNWVVASSCGDGTNDLCAAFPKPVGREVRWKATLCSNSAHSTTPNLTKVEISFDYTQAREHFRAGVTVNNGVAYAAGFKQPGDRGQMFAVNAALDHTYWNASTDIDGRSDSSRHIYTSNTTASTLLDFSTDNADSSVLQATMEVADETQAATVIDWIRSKRFGVGNLGLAMSRLGAIENSTPAVLTKPGIPLWYVYGSATDRARHLTFEAAQANRKTLVLFGSKDGMIHAIQTDPAAISTAPSGTEAWAFVPPKIASGMVSDYTDSLTGSLVVKSYPDGSPTLADFKKSNGDFATAMITSSGNGGKGLVALDVTQTVDMGTGAIEGPSPMWTAVPGQADAGQGQAKPAVGRVLIGGREHYEVIAATGIGYDNAAPPWIKGRVVAGYDLADGKLLWQFRAVCPVTSDVVAFETDDELEPGAPTINGYVDRVAFADACGHLYKVDPGKDLNGGWNDNRTLGTFEVDDIAGVKQMALFYTKDTSGALGQESPITGTVAARSDNTSRVVLFFGTGGLENAAVTNHNAFFAVYADDGEVRSKFTGECDNDGRCEKFYGGVVVTEDQVIFTRTTDPLVGTNACDFGSSTLEIMDVNTGANGTFAEDFSQTVAAAIMGAVYGDAGAIYFSTLSGTVARIGTPRASSAGGDSSGSGIPVFGQGGENSTGAGATGTIAALDLLGWRQVY